MIRQETINGLLHLRGVDDPPGQPAGSGPAGLRLEHRLVINAPREAIWQVLANVAEWPRWSTLYPAAQGELKEGAWLHITIQVPGSPGVKSRAEVQTCVPGELLVFKSISPLGELATGVRYFQIQATGDNTCVVTDGEVVGGAIGVGLARVWPGHVYDGLRLMNEGLKTEAERLQSTMR